MVYIRSERIIKMTLNGGCAVDKLEKCVGRSSFFFFASSRVCRVSSRGLEKNGKFSFNDCSSGYLVSSHRYQLGGDVRVLSGMGER